MFPSYTQIVTGTARTTCIGGIAIDILEDTEFTEIEGRINGYAGITFPAGKLIFVNEIKSITLASGSVIVYFR